MSKERWKDVVGYKGLYKVSDTGRVRRSKEGINTAIGKILRHLIGSNGYPSVALYKNGKRKQPTVHSLVLQAFVGPCPFGMECCHYDGERSNPNLCNLRWGTRSSNRDDSRRHGTLNNGSRNSQSVLDEQDVLEIKNHLNGDLMNGRQIAKLFQVSESTISSIKHKRNWSWLDE